MLTEYGGRHFTLDFFDLFRSRCVKSPQVLTFVLDSQISGGNTQRQISKGLKSQVAEQEEPFEDEC